MNLLNHPCFNDKVRHTFGRVHLPVAPRCNIQCKFCNRKYDCVNESRPGVTSGVLSPTQAMVYLDSVLEHKKNISVVGLAGPGDPFANPDETMETLRRVRSSYPDMLLCVATNGLGIGPYIEELAQLQVSHVTLTVNAVDPVIGQQIYAWVRYGKRVFHPVEGARILLERQLEAITRLKESGIVVKINTIILPGINDAHIPEVAERMGKMDVDILNCVPYYPHPGASFADIPEPTPEMIAHIRKQAGQFIPQMHHCTRCRADAVGLLGEDMPPELLSRLKTCETLGEISPRPPLDKSRPNIAVASREGVLVNQHLGEAEHLLIYGRENGAISLIESRRTPESGGGMQRWHELADTLRDCNMLLVSGVGANPRSVLTGKGIEVLEIEGLIHEAVHSVFEGKNLRHLTRRKRTACGVGCSGSGAGCG